MFRTLCNSDIFKTLVAIFRTLEYSDSDAYSEFYKTSMLVCNGYNYFRNISFSLSLLYEVNIINVLIQNFDILVSICFPGFVLSDYWTITEL